ncbi:MAG: methylmalonyl-CoA epimerase [Marine Group III euryarchaeote CG-Bathy2]|mgnify:CR=1 FL=1|uniref:Methylmalonyl-CoA (MCEE, epi) n=3 Tax=Methanobacteriati TaxID=3366610 RepID=A0A075GT60_9EURY|nr:methylmalonyl-CoA (MCEE, epi) [uncultured marine group II/III euryarchaeote KM3_177_C07]AIF06375.1 methylmalonyl-CoA (MCEE, epi) [uncultured marine group II/III euryarchaeote KM3_191_F05]OIR13033.1 MAG: methylmalonyl-CoA epimerase [Marine Group III euryarchaeote CG-Bathy2]
MGEETRLRHVAVAVKSIDTALPLWEALGLRLRHTEGVPSEGVRTAHLAAGGAEVELLEPLADDSPVGRFLAKQGPGLHHVALEVPDLSAALDRCSAAGLEPLGGGARDGTEGTRVAFFHPRDTGGVLLELVEPAPKPV